MRSSAGSDARNEARSARGDTYARTHTESTAALPSMTATSMYLAAYGSNVSSSYSPADAMRHSATAAQSRREKSSAPSFPRISSHETTMRHGPVVRTFRPMNPDALRSPSNVADSPDASVPASPSMRVLSKPCNS